MFKIVTFNHSNEWCHTHTHILAHFNSIYYNMTFLFYNESTIDAVWPLNILFRFNILSMYQVSHPMCLFHRKKAIWQLARYDRLIKAIELFTQIDDDRFFCLLKSANNLFKFCFIQMFSTKFKWYHLPGTRKHWSTLNQLVIWFWATFYLLDHFFPNTKSTNRFWNKPKKKTQHHLLA